MDKDLHRIVTFTCEGDGAVCYGTVRGTFGNIGVLIVSGGNEVRIGAGRGMALLCQRLAEAGVATFRFDRRGVGDSEGDNRGWSGSAPDIAAALAAFRREQPQLTHVVGFGNCDAATVLALHAPPLDALVLANPWLGDEQAPPPPAAARAYYARRLREPSAWRGLLTGNVASRLLNALGKQPEQPLAARMNAALGRIPTTVVLATGDRTAQVFAAAVKPPPGVRTVKVDTASHSFAGEGAALDRVLLQVIADLRDNTAA